MAQQHHQGRIETFPLPPYDPQITALEDTQHRPIPASLEELIELRRNEERCDEEFLNDPDLVIGDHTIPGPDGVVAAITLSRRVSLGEKKPRPGILFCHGGGRLMGNVFVGLNTLSQTVKDLDAIVLSVNYRLSPEHHGIKAVEDCYTSLVWFSQNIELFNVDPTRFMIAGTSAGAGLAAGAALMSRDRNGPKLRGQLLVCPMLDDRCTSLSCRQFENGHGFYTAWSRYAWACVLGSQSGEEESEVSVYVAPGRATDLSNLPVAYIDAGSGEPFRDEDITYATKLWECGVQAHLHIWGGGSHGFDLFYDIDLGAQARLARQKWLKELLRDKDSPLTKTT